MSKYLLFILSITVVSIAPTLVESKESVDPKMAKQYIAEILSQPEFKTTREESRWRYTNEQSAEEYAEETPARSDKSTSISFGFTGFIAQLLELLLWILLGVGIILLVIYGSRWLEQWRPPKSAKQEDYTATPRLLQKGIKGAVLQKEISQQAWALWQSGNAVAAISLLYRGALSVLITRDGLTIDESATESECLRRVKYKQPVELTAYFSGLTRAWQKIAYAGRPPSDVEAQRLCEQWQQHFQ
ncbi:MAG TPA: DUF4129 domain-containing protein [Thioploca sp.]|nr:MAG: hypothetical protein B6247_27425 [Beggiatoa sp. 4572_84]RKZ55901.1 MAG: hypothetical protein DRR08_23070 [Gammaproteobacteria bacterium]HDN26699.1 DUF4129 domain-containing protein [Thioploca sp.]